MEAVAYKISSKEEADRIVAECNGTVIEVK